MKSSFVPVYVHNKAADPARRISPSAPSGIPPRRGGMKGKAAALAALAVILILPVAAAEDGPALGLTAEGTMNTRSGVAFGGGLLLGWDVNGTMLGLRGVISLNGAPMRTLETLLVARFYLPSLRGWEGFFAQLEMGPCFLMEDGYVTGAVSAGLMAGWRFPLGRRWFVEPFVRAGYPFIAGAGMGGGLRF